MNSSNILFYLTLFILLYSLHNSTLHEVYGAISVIRFSQLTFQSLAVTLHTIRFNIKKILRGAHIAFMCFVRISEQTATFAL
jgi:hypothetical protein